MVMQQPQYAPPAPSTFDPTQVYVPHRFQQSYVPQSFTEQYGLASAFPLAPGVQVPGGEGGGEMPIIFEPPPVVQPPIDGFTPQTFMDAGTYENPGDLGAGGAPSPEGGLFQQEGAPTYEGVGTGSGEADDQGNPFLDPWVIGGLVGATGALAAPWLWANRPFNNFQFGNITEPRQRQVGTEGEAWRGRRQQPMPGPGDDADAGGRRQITARGGGRRMLPSGSEGDGGNPRLRTGGGSGTVTRMDTPYRDRLLREMGRRGYRWDGRTWVRVGPDAPSETPQIRLNPRVGNLVGVAPPRAVGLSSFGEFPTSQAAAQIRGNPWFNQRVPYSMQAGNVNAAMGRGPTAVITNPFTPRPR